MNPFLFPGASTRCALVQAPSFMSPVRLENYTRGCQLHGKEALSVKGVGGLVEDSDV